MSNSDIITSLKEKEDRPLSFSNEELELAKNFFNTNNYFSFTIYRKLLPRIKSKNYSFSDALDVYKFNDFLRSELNKFTGNLELMLRSTLIQHLGAYYEGKKKEDKFQKSIELIEMVFQDKINGIKKIIDKTSATEKKNYDRFIHSLQRKYEQLKINLEDTIKIEITQLLKEYLILHNDKNAAFEDIQEFNNTFSQIIKNETNEYSISLEYIKGKGIPEDKVSVVLKKILPDENFQIYFEKQLEIITKNLITNNEEIISQENFTFETGLLYKDTSIYVSDKVQDIQELMSRFENTINASKSDAIKHYRGKNDVGVPIWVLFEELTFGDVYRFLSLLKTDLKNFWIEKSFEKELENFVPGWFRSVNFLRNNCAHYNRLYGRFFNVSPPSLLKEDTNLANITNQDNKTLFSNLLVIKNLLKYHITQKNEWNIFLLKLKNHIEEKQEILRISEMGFPENWIECLTIKL